MHQVNNLSYTSNAIATSSKFINDSSSSKHATVTSPLMTNLEQTLLTNIDQINLIQPVSVVSTKLSKLFLLIIKFYTA